MTNQVQIPPLNIRICKGLSGFSVEVYTDDLDHYVHETMWQSEAQAKRLFERIIAAKGCVNLDHWVKVTPDERVTETCIACSGTGVYDNGDATGACYRCQGKGYQTPADVKRNAYYDRCNNR